MPRHTNIISIELPPDSEAILVDRSDDCSARVAPILDVRAPSSKTEPRHDWIPQEPVPDASGRIACALVWCPEVPSGTRFSFYRRLADGSCLELEEGVLDCRAPSLNLARLRQRGAQLGAEEVVLILP